MNLDSNGNYQGIFKIDVSRPSLIDFKTGKIERSGKNLTFFAVAKYEWKVNYWTLLTVDKILPSPSTQNFHWLRYATYKTDFGYNVIDYKYQDYNVNWQYYNSYYSYDFTQPIFRISYDPFPTRESSEWNSTTQIYYSNVIAKNAEIKAIGEYQAQYSSYNVVQINLQDTNAIQSPQNSPPFPEMSNTLKNQMIGKFLGDNTGVKPQSPSWEQVGQEIIVGDTPGAVISITPQHRFTSNIRIKPGIFLLKQRIIAAGTHLEHRLPSTWQGEEITYYKQMSSLDQTYIRGAKTTNKNLQQKYEMEVTIISSLALKGEKEAESLLGSPVAELSDIYWDLSINGETEAWIMFMKKYTTADFLYDSQVAAGSIVGILNQFLPYIILVIAIIAVIYFWPVLSRLRPK